VVLTVDVGRCVGCENTYIHRNISICTCIYVCIASRGVECENIHTRFCCIYRIHICILYILYIDVFYIYIDVFYTYIYIMCM